MERAVVAKNKVGAEGFRALMDDIETVAALIRGNTRGATAGGRRTLTRGLDSTGGRVHGIAENLVPAEVARIQKSGSGERRRGSPGSCKLTELRRTRQGYWGCEKRAKGNIPHGNLP